VDQSLVLAARAGDEEAFGSLARGSADRLFAVAHRILRDVGLAEDAVQQALVTAWRELPGLRDADRFEAWLHRILVHACYAEARRARRWTANVQVLPLDGPADRDTTIDVVTRDIVDRTFDVEGITFTLGDGWSFEGQETDNVNLAIRETDTSPAWLAFTIVDEVYPDPCGAPGVPTATPLGPSVDDLVTALTTLEGYDASAVSDVTIGGLPARSFVLTDAADIPCQPDTLIGLADTVDTNLDSILHFVVLEVGGQRLLIQNAVLSASAHEKEPAESVTTIDEVINTITFQ